jgi:hypothetical protein
VVEPFDARAAAEAMRTRPLVRVDRQWLEDPLSYLRGRWEDRHPLNAPGPFYGAATDTCCDGPPYAPRSLLYDEDGAGFVWRQPRDEDEVYELLCGASSDPFSGYGWDGDDHWTPELVRAWWRDLDAEPATIERIVSALTGPRREIRSEYEDLLFRCLPIGGYADDERQLIRGIVGDFLEYRRSGLRRDLRRYLFFLDHGAYPRTDETLPEL